MQRHTQHCDILIFSLIGRLFSPSLSPTYVQDFHFHCSTLIVFVRRLSDSSLTVVFLRLFSFSLRIFIEKIIKYKYIRTQICPPFSESWMEWVEKMKWMGKRDKGREVKKSPPLSRLWKFFFLLLFSTLRTYVKHKFVKQQKGEFSAYIHSTYCCLLDSEENVFFLSGWEGREGRVEKKKDQGCLEHEKASSTSDAIRKRELLN